MTFRKPEQLCTWSGPENERLSQYFICNRLSQPTEQRPFKCNSLWTPVSLKTFAGLSARCFYVSSYLQDTVNSSTKQGKWLVQLTTTGLKSVVSYFLYFQQ